MPPLLLTTRRQPAATSPECGAAGPLEVALSLLVHRTFPFRPASTGVAADWLGLHDPALAGSAAAVADGRQISRQRAQTVLGALRAAATGMPPPPALLRALALLDGGPPAQPAADAAHSLQSAGLTVGHLHPADVLAAARPFHLDHGVALRGPCPGTTVISASQLPTYDQAVPRLRTTARRRGLVHLDDLAGDQPDVVRLALHDSAGVAAHGGWYWTLPDHSPLPRILARMLTVCGPLPDAELIAGLHRATRYSPTATRHIPAETLQAYLASQHRPQTATHRAPRRPDAAGLTATDQALAGACAAHGTGRLPTAELVRALHNAGLGARSPHTLIGLSPLLRQVRTGIQELCGPAERDGSATTAVQRESRLFLAGTQPRFRRRRRRYPVKVDGGG